MVNWIVVGVFAFIFLAIVGKHWDKIQPLVQSIFKGGKKLRKGNSDAIEIQREDFEKYKAERIEKLIKKRQNIKNEIRKKTEHLEEQLRQVDMELASLQREG